MPLDAESIAILEARKKAALPDVTSLPIDEVRRSRDAWRVSNSAPPSRCFKPSTIPSKVQAAPSRFASIVQDKPTRAPILLYLHGGGWVFGDLEQNDGLCRLLAVESGCVVVNVDYRLAPENRYPAAADDCYAVLCWAAQHAAEFGADPGRIVIAGSSAGGNLAAAVTLMSRDRGGPRIAAQILVYPVLDDSCAFPSHAEFSKGHILSTDEMRWYWRQYLDGSGAAGEPYACPLKATDLSDLPRCSRDHRGMRSGARRWRTAMPRGLRGAGVPVKLTRYPGTLHGFFAMAASCPRRRAAVREASEFRPTAVSGDA